MIDIFKDTLDELPEEVPIDLMELNLFEPKQHVEWTMDSRASVHVTREQKELVDLTKMPPGVEKFYTCKFTLSKFARHGLISSMIIISRGFSKGKWIID